MLNHAMYPFAAVVGQQQIKKAILIALVNPKASGLLIGGKKGTGKSTLVRSAANLLDNQQMINLPLNITEDMLFGSIDIERAVKQGERHFAAGVLSRANNNILYIDEINLLRQELLIAVLDANITGVNRVERDGISFTEEVHYTVIGTMNPEEGTLPAHILDRFGMYADAENENEVEQRAEIMRRLLAYSKNMPAFEEAYADETNKLRKQIAEAKAMLPKIEISEAILNLAAAMCAQAFCAGHRAEIYLLEAARAVAALEGRTYILPKDMDEAAIYVLAHRMRKPPEQESDEQQESEDNDTDSTESDDQNNEDGEDNTDEETPDDAESHSETPSPSQQSDDNDLNNDDNQNKNDENKQNNNLAADEQISDIDKTLRLPKIILDMGKDNTKRRGSGKRSNTKTDLKQGRYVRAQLPRDKVEDLAFDATIRAAAPYQKLRQKNGCALAIKDEDLRQKVREKRIGSTFLFAVDASGSMGAKERMRAVKGAIFYMLQEAYQKRDRVGMIAFRRQQAEVLLPITRSVDLAQKQLAELPTGGKTPLADGLALALTILCRLSKKDREMEPILVLVTDGRANAVDADGTDGPVESAIKMAEHIRKAKITSVVIDTEKDFIKLGIAKQIAAAMGASYYTLSDLSKESILRIVRNLGE